MEILNIEIEELTDETVSVLYRDETTGLPINLTGYSAIMELRPNFGDANLILTLSTANGAISLGGVNGTVDMAFDKADTNQQNSYAGWRRAAYDLIVIDPQGDRKKILKGFVTLARSASID